MHGGDHWKPRLAGMGITAGASCVGYISGECALRWGGSFGMPCMDLYGGCLCINSVDALRVCILCGEDPSVNALRGFLSVHTQHGFIWRMPLH